MAILSRPSNVKRAPLVRPKLNVNALYDMQNGRMLLGMDGRWYLNGGLAALNAFGGRGNTWKSTTQRTFHLKAHARYCRSKGFGENMDSEFSVDPFRSIQLMSGFRPEEQWGMMDELENPEGSYNVTDNSEQTGDYWWNMLHGDLDARAAAKRSDKIATPFRDYEGGLIHILPVWHYDLDSASQLSMASTIKQQDKGTAGSAEQQTIWMRDAGAKAQMITQMSYDLPRGGAFLSMTAHLDDSIKLDQYAPSTKKLAGLKGDLKFKGVPGRQFTFLPASCYIATAEGNLLDSNKMPEYGLDERDSQKNDTDLKIVRYEQLRGKGGPTGIVQDFIYSQQEGMQEELGYFYYLHKILGGYGMKIKGNSMGFNLDLYPDVYFTRNTIRNLIKTDLRFARALEITVMMAYERAQWHAEPELYKMEPVTLYNLIKNKGYDWNDILSNTVYWWHFNDDAASVGKHTVTHRTLIDMAMGLHEAVYLESYPGKSNGSKV